MPAEVDQILGVVSNCWKTQLDAGEPLEQLIEQAVEFGFRAVELRQGALGDYESMVADAGSSRFAYKRLAWLSQSFPDVALNLAVSFPCFGSEIRDDSAVFLHAIQAARAIGSGRPIHLRIVDTQTRLPKFDLQTIHAASNLIARLTTKLADAGGTLSIEHSYQNWSDFLSMMQFAKDQLASHSSKLLCCFDPCNLLLMESVDSVTAIVESIPSDFVAMIHLKQRREGRILPDLGEGDLDWPQLIRLLDHSNCQCPWMFEVAPDGEVWTHLRRSIAMISHLRGH